MTHSSSAHNPDEIATNTATEHANYTYPSLPFSMDEHSHEEENNSPLPPLSDSEDEEMEHDQSEDSYSAFLQRYHASRASKTTPSTVSQTPNTEEIAEKTPELSFETYEITTSRQQKTSSLRELLSTSNPDRNDKNLQTNSSYETRANSPLQRSGSVETQGLSSDGAPSPLEHYSYEDQLRFSLSVKQPPYNENTSHPTNLISPPIPDLNSPWAQGGIGQNYSNEYQQQTMGDQPIDDCFEGFHTCAMS